MEYGREIIKIIFYLALVIGIIYIIQYFFRRTFIMQNQGKYIEIVDKIYFGPKKGLFLVRIQDKILLISVTDNKISELKQWDELDFKLEAGEDKKDFKKYLMKFFNNADRRDKK